MKGLTISTIAYLTVGIVSLTLLMSFLVKTYGPSLKDSYCKIVLGLNSLLPLPEHMKPSLPLYCKTSDLTCKQEIVYNKEPERVAYMVASYVLACWEKTGKINLARDVPCCFELYFPEINGKVTGENVKTQIPSQYQNIFVWSVTGDITSQKSVAIGYINKKIIVI